jgi:hypothetical protein
MFSDGSQGMNVSPPFGFTETGRNDIEPFPQRVQIRINSTDFGQSQVAVAAKGFNKSPGRQLNCRKAECYGNNRRKNLDDGKEANLLFFVSPALRFA